MKNRSKVIIGSIVLVLVLVSLSLYYVVNKMNNINRVVLPKSDEELGITHDDDKRFDDQIINIAFFGIDARNVNQRSRSDSMIIMTIDKKNKKIKMTSLMRDMYVNIPGHGGDRLNHAYAYGGPILALKTINSNFGLDIRYFVTVNFFGLEYLIDSIGGVNINVSANEAKVLNSYLVELNRLNGDKVPPVIEGEQILNGRQAVAYCRIRYVGNGDYERTERQRRVLTEVLKNIKAQGILGAMNTIEKMIPYVQTNMSNSEILSLSKDILSLDIQNAEQYRLPVDGTFTSQRIRGMAVLVPNIEENRNKLKNFIYNN